MKFAVVAVGYNRINSMKRLISSLLKADYLGDEVDLIISIDNSGKTDVEEYAKSVVWPYGNSFVKTYQERMGLRKHILTCGDFVFEYDAIAVFEDDIYVSPAFYSYMKKTVEFYHDDTNVAGISLYSHFWSEYHQRPFVPEKKRYDNYFLKYAQSWGQIWMPKQWQMFKEWYANNLGEIKKDENTPEHICDWPKTSWLKYHIKYCIDTNKYFVYPYMSYTTNFVEIGEHCSTSNTVYQVPMQYEVVDDYNFCDFGNKDGVYYDAYFEREHLNDYLGYDVNDVCIDLYGHKSTGKRYLLTTKQLNYHIEKKFALALKPHERNIIEGLVGEEIFLYDMSKKEKNEFLVDFDISRWYYDSRIFDYKYIVKTLAKIFKTKMIKK